MYQEDKIRVFHHGKVGKVLSFAKEPQLLYLINRALTAFQEL